VTLVKMKEPSAALKAVNVLCNTQPHSIAKYNNPDMAETLESIVAKETFDCVHVDHVHMAHYRSYFPSLPAVVDEHNVEYRILERCYDVEKKFLKKMVYANQARKMKSFEKNRLKEYSACCAVSADDRKILEDLTEGKIPVFEVPNGVDTEFFKTEFRVQSSEFGSSETHKKNRTQELLTPNSELSLVFTGSMDWLPNEDAVLYFCQEVLPLVWQTSPQVKFYVVGKAPSQAIKNFAHKDKRIIVTGRVDDVRPIMAQAKIFVVPIRVGGGTRLKILEAMSMEKAIVSTTIGAEGIAYTAGKNILLADTPQAFAQTILKLLPDINLIHKLGQEGRRLVLNQYDWNIIGQRLLKIYEEIREKTGKR